jgi:hypothetical protein
MALNEKGYKTKSYTSEQGRKFGGISFKNTNVQIILRNILYTGKVAYHSHIYDGEQERIVSDKVFQEAQKILNNNRREHRIAGSKKNVGLLSNILRCKACDSSMYYAYSKKGKYKYRYYLCMNAQKRGYKCCPTRLIPAQVIETKFIENLRRAMPKSAIESDSWNALTLPEQIKTLKEIIKCVNYDANEGILEILLHNGKSHKFDLRIEELKRIPNHKRKIEITKEPPIRKNLVLAHHIQVLIENKRGNLNQVAQWLGLTYPRICHVLNMLNISPEIQEVIILSQDKRLYRIPEYRLRDITAEIDWEKQRQIWTSLLESIQE